MSLRTANEIDGDQEFNPDAEEETVLTETDAEEGDNSPSNAIDPDETEKNESGNEDETGDPNKPEEQDEEKSDKPKKIYQARYRLKSAPNGKCNTAVTYRGKDISIELVDGVFTPKEMSEEEERDFRTFMLSMPEWEYLPLKLVKTKKKKDAPEKFIFKVSHPDNTPDSKVNSLVSYMLHNKARNIQCVEGTIETEDPLIYEALMKKGYNLVSKIPID